MAINYSYVEGKQKLPDFLRNYEELEEGWFSKSSINGMIFSAINGKSESAANNYLLRLFDDGINSYATYDGINPQEKALICIDNLQSIENSTYEFDSDELLELYNKLRTNSVLYINGNVANEPCSSHIGTFARYGEKLSTLNINIRNLIRNKENDTESETIYPRGIYIINGEDEIPVSDEVGLKEKIADLLKQNGTVPIYSKYKDSKDPTIQTRVDEKFKQYLEKVQNFKVSLGTVFDEDFKIESTSEFKDIFKIIMDFLKRNDIPSLFMPLINDSYSSNYDDFKNQFSEILEDDNLHFFKRFFANDGIYSLNFDNDDEHIQKLFINNMATFLNTLEYEFKTGIGHDLENNNLKTMFKYNKNAYKVREIFYFTKNSKKLYGNSILDFTSAEKNTETKKRDKYSTIGEVSLNITKSELNSNASKYILKGIRLYLYSNAGKTNPTNKKIKTSEIQKYLSIEEITKTSIKKAEQYSISEIAFFFRNVDNNRLYKYMLNIRAKLALIDEHFAEKDYYFIPFITKELSEQNVLYECWYGVHNNGTPGTSSGTINKEPMFIKPYIQIGDFGGDRFGINGKATYGPRIDDPVRPINEDDMNRPTILGTINYDNPNKRGNSQQTTIEKESLSLRDIKASDIKDCILGCFSDKPLNKNSKDLDDGWAFSSNPMSKKVKFLDGEIPVKYEANIKNGSINQKYEIFDFESFLKDRIQSITSVGISSLLPIQIENKSFIPLPGKKINSKSVLDKIEEKAGATLMLEDSEKIQVEPGDVLFEANFDTTYDVKCQTKENKVIAIYGKTNYYCAYETNGEAITIEKNFAETHRLIKLIKSSSVYGNEEDIYLCSDEWIKIKFGYGIDKEGLDYIIDNGAPEEIITLAKKAKKQFTKIVDKPQTANQKLVVGDALTSTEATKILRYLLNSNYYKNSVITYLKRFAVALDGERNTSVQNAHIKYGGYNISPLADTAIMSLSQKTYELLLFLKFKGLLNIFATNVISQICKKIGERNSEEELTQEEKNKILQESLNEARVAINDGYDRSKTQYSWFKCLQENFGETDYNNSWNLAEQKKVSDENSRVEFKKLSIELICKSVSSCLIDSVLGKDAINKIKE